MSCVLSRVLSRVLIQPYLLTYGGIFLPSLLFLSSSFSFSPLLVKGGRLST